MSKEIYKPLDYVPDKHDEKDWLMKKQDVVRKLGKDTWIQMKRDTPKKLSHRDNMSAVKSQQSQPACTGFAIAAVAEWYVVQRWLKLKKDKGEEIPVGSNPFSDLSERWIYEHARDFDPFPEGTEGSTIRAALKVMQKLGIPTESAWPYYDEHSGGPEEGAEKLADMVTIDNYYKVKTGSIRDHIWALFHSPIPVALEVYEELYEPDSNGKVATPDHNSKKDGAHALAMTGYHKDDEDTWFELKNSWGSENYGDNGYIYISRKYLHRHELSAWSFNSISSFNPKDIQEAVNLMESGSDSSGDDSDMIPE